MQQPNYTKFTKKVMILPTGILQLITTLHCFLVQVEQQIDKGALLETFKLTQKINQDNTTSY
jgi:hypothetical protein